MATVQEIIANKGSTVRSLEKSATVLEAVHFMTEHRIGGLVVTDRGRFAGMFTERDLLTRVVGEGRDPKATTVSEVMTEDVVCCTAETSIEEARAAMRDRRIRHLPMMDSEGQLCGLVSIGDLNAYALANQEQTIHMLHEYLYGRV